MKKIIKLPAIVLGLMLLLTGTTQKVMAQDEDVSMQSFYDELSPYGTWIQDPQYGYVWRPDVEQGDFRPYYTNGRWAMTEYGNTWVSNYDWGWAPFHYGRWVFNNYRQWVWIPDTTWGPAWVSWRSGGGYYGWAPMGPGMNININFNIPDLWWVFIPQRNIYYDSFPRYYSRRNVVYMNNTTIINNTYVNNRRTYYTGPRADDIRRDTRQDVRVYNVNNTGRPSRSNISGNNLNLYTPRASRGNSNTNAAPRQAIKGEGYTTMRGDRNSNNSGSNTNGSNTNGSGRTSRMENRGNDNRENGVTDTRGNRGNGYPSSENNRSGVTPESREGRPGYDNNSRSSRTEGRENNGTAQPQRTEGTTPTRENHIQRPQSTPQSQTDRRARYERGESNGSGNNGERVGWGNRSQRTEVPAQQQPAQKTGIPRSEPVQKTEVPRSEPRSVQPQRQESRQTPQPQVQRPQPVQQNVQPSRSTESRGSERSSQGSRPGRGGRG